MHFTGCSIHGRAKADRKINNISTATEIKLLLVILSIADYGCESGTLQILKISQIDMCDRPSAVDPQQPVRQRIKKMKVSLHGHVSRHNSFSRHRR